MIVVYYTTNRLTKPFMEINEIVQKYAKGDYNVRIPISSVEEATQLAVSFNNMADQLKTEVLMHPLERLEGGLTPIESRCLEELGAGCGAGKVRVWTGARLGDSEARSRLDGG